MTVLSLGGVYSLVAATVYALPVKSSKIRVQQSGGTIQTSVDNSNWGTITLDANLEFTTAAMFIKAVSTDATITVKET